jgi:hypothetical protein
LNNNKSPIILVVALAIVVLLAPASAFAQKHGPTGDEIIEANYSGLVYTSIHTGQRQILPVQPAQKI